MREGGKKLQSAKFTVDLGGLELPADIGEKIDRGIRKSVLSALAEIDFKGELGVRLPPDLWGIIIDPSQFEPRFRG